MNAFRAVNLYATKTPEGRPYYRGLAMHLGTDSHDREAARQERSIELLARVAPTSREEISDLLASELARLGRDARVRNYLHVLATSSVRGMLLRRTRREHLSAERG